MYMYMYMYAYLIYMVKHIWILESNFSTESVDL